MNAQVEGPRVLLSVASARQRILSAFDRLPAEVTNLAEAAGRTLAATIQAEFDLPQFANSAMDGFAVRAADTAAASPSQPVELDIVADIAAGSYPETPIQPGQAARIMTGSALPPGSDAVAPFEVTDYPYRQLSAQPPLRVRLTAPVQTGADVRPAGQDMRRGAQALPDGTRLRPQELGFLAMLGFSAVPLVRLAKAAVLSTGDELTPAGERLLPGKIFDANGAMLAALLAQDGASVLHLGISPDRPEEIRARLEAARQAGVDLIVSSAGVSVGAFDFVRQVVEEEGSLDFWRVNMRPGKPLAFGSYAGIPFFGLPGNPVSAFVGYQVFVRPALRKLHGQGGETAAFKATLLEEIQSDGRESYLRGMITAGEQSWEARLTGHQGSGNLFSLVQANALLIIPSAVKSLPAGSRVDAWWLA